MSLLAIAGCSVRSGGDMPPGINSAIVKELALHGVRYVEPAGFEQPAGTPTGGYSIYVLGEYISTKEPTAALLTFELSGRRWQLARLIIDGKEIPLERVRP